MSEEFEILSNELWESIEQLQVREYRQRGGSETTTTVDPTPPVLDEWDWHEATRLQAVEWIVWQHGPIEADAIQDELIRVGRYESSEGIGSSLQVLRRNGALFRSADKHWLRVERRQAIG